MIDPLAAAAGIGLLGPVLAGPSLARALGTLAARARRRVEWGIILAAVGLAIAGDVLQDGPGVGGALIYVVAALPGLITFLVWRSQLASAVVSMAPMYFVVSILTRERATHQPALALDGVIPLHPAWMLVYGSLYVFVIVLPLLVVRDRALIRRALQGYLLVMALSYAIFLVYPTSAPRPDAIGDAGFAAWTLRILYSLDPPYNCFPSLHVAYAFVSALACLRVHRGVGAAAVAWAALIGVSTLFTKQHYAADVVAGTAAASLAYVLFLRARPDEPVPEHDRRRAPARALGAVGVFAIMIAGFAVAYHFES
ncbi:MAG TPA: phosphatase PAP2 family protein [Vicinamibacterales bacterium]|nr:phosphatase PAP2 family protein [Vicinamibacterales bacterium]